MSRALNINSSSHYSRGQFLLFAALWSVAVAGCVAVYFLQHGWHADRGLISAVLPYLVGGFIGGWISLALASRFVGDRTGTVRFSFMFVALTVFSLGITTLIFVLQYQIYFSQWHAEFGSVKRLFQLLFTGLGAAFLMLATGLRPLLPWGIVLLAIVSFGFSRGWFSVVR